MEKVYEKVQIVDEHDTVIGADHLFPALERGCIFRAARVFVFDTEGKLLIQKRSSRVLHPRVFDQSAGGHVDAGETYLEAATRELKEEIGLVECDLIEIAMSHRINDSFNSVHKVVVPAGTAIEFDQEEVESVHWMSVSEIEFSIENFSGSWTPDFVEVWQFFKSKLIQ